MQSHTCDQVLGFDMYMYLQQRAVLHLSYKLGAGGGGNIVSLNGFVPDFNTHALGNCIIILFQARIRPPSVKVDVPISLWFCMLH